MAAVLAVGPGAVLSHRSAAALLGLRPTARHAVDVTTAGGAHSRPGIDLHCVRALPGTEVTSLRRVPCTTAARTLLDLAEVLSRRDLERALDQAEVAGAFDRRGLEELLANHPTRRGGATLRTVLAEYAIGGGLTRSELEERFLALCLRAGLPRPELNVPLLLPDSGAAVVDALWRRECLVAETDGLGAHSTRAAFERDRHRDAQLTLAGFTVVRFTWRQVTKNARQVAVTLGRLLEQGGSAGADRDRARSNGDHP